MDELVMINYLLFVAIFKAGVLVRSWELTMVQIKFKVVKLDQRIFTSRICSLPVVKSS